MSARHSVRIGHSVTAEPLSEVLRLADVEYRFTRVAHEIYAWALWQLSEEVAPQLLNEWLRVRKKKFLHRRHDENLVFGRLQPLRHCRLNDRSIWQQDHEVKLPECTLDRVGEANQPKRNGHCPKFLRFQCSDLYVIKGGHKVGSNLCGFLFGYGIGRILFTDVKDVFQSAAITVRPTAPEGAARG
jgi:hypothetical protein